MGQLSPADYREYVLPYSRRALEIARQAGVPIIHFGTDTAGMLPLIQEAGGDVIGVDWRIDLAQAWRMLGPEVAVQGNLDPVALFAPWPQLQAAGAGGDRLGAQHRAGMGISSTSGTASCRRRRWTTCAAWWTLFTNIRTQRAGGDRMNTARSEALFAQAQQLIPGGVNSPVRAFRSVGGTPRFIERGQGACVWDVDGNRYIDYVLSWGPLALGHAHPAVVAALQEAATRGTSYGAPTALESELAQLVIDLVPSIEMIRFVNSGTEATMSALRLARAYTGRTKIVKFSGCYHGHADMLLVQAGSGVATLGLPDSPGVPRGDGGRHADCTVQRSGRGGGAVCRQSRTRLPA